MTDEAKQRWLGHAVRRGLLTPMQAADVAEVDLPLQTAWPTSLPDEVWREALRELVALARDKEKADDDWQKSLAAVHRWRLRMLLQAHEAVQDEANRRHARWASLLAAGILTLADWQQRMQGQARKTLTMQTVLGLRRLPNALERAEAERLLKRESLFLQGFADDIAAREIRGEPLTEGQIRSRANLYTGTARGEFYRGFEQVAERGKGAGWVAEYIARDDRNTCSACHAAQGYWLPGQGPWPGQVCAGRAQCRCRRVLRYLPDEWRRLIARA